ncbi:MAG: hypothetical protein F6K30_17550 [Cyanothece sp. SIO2G6]|nr:hypothetical protein [Cyanothece sp. SIO2G6]
MEDSTLPSTFEPLVVDQDFSRIGTLVRGHMTASAERNRSPKDLQSTFIMTNALPQESGNNSLNTAWNNLERFTYEQALNGRDLYITSGSVGSQGVLQPIEENGSSKPYDITIPEFTWKNVLILDRPGLSVEEVRDDGYLQLISVITPNIPEPKPEDFSSPIAHPLNELFPGRFAPIASLDAWTAWQTWEVNIQDLESVTKLNLLPALDQPLSASLRTFFSGENLAVGPSPGELSTIRHDRIFKDQSDTATVSSNIFITETLAKHNIFSISSTEGDFSQIDVLKEGFKQSSTSKISFGQIDIGEFTATEVSPVTSTSFPANIIESTTFKISPYDGRGIHFGPIKNRGVDVSTSQIDSGQISFNEASFSDTSSMHLGITEVGLVQNNIVEDDTSQPGTTQISTSQVAINESRSSEISIPQIDSSQIKPIQAASTKRFSSGVFLKKFLSIHDVDPSLLDANEISLGLQEYILQASPIFPQLEFIVRDLPSGQLAEATITRFDTSGVPIAGTILIDDDANGLGWYIDPTPWDNTEYHPHQTNTLLKATPDSPAYGRYDLLTTVLHELGHLAGIIHGNPAYDDRIQYLNGTPPLSATAMPTNSPMI